MQLGLLLWLTVMFICMSELNVYIANVPLVKVNRIIDLQGVNL